MTAFTAGALQSPAHRALLGDLWSTLFMVRAGSVDNFRVGQSDVRGFAEEVSVGFSSTRRGRRCRRLRLAPSCARSARSWSATLCRSRRWSRFPSGLPSEICKFFEVDQNIWAAPVASAQTLADTASRFKSTFRTDDGDREVGIPLLVHRRCQDPMFSVSNENCLCRSDGARGRPGRPRRHR